MRRTKKLCVDFDGTIVEHKFPEIGELKLNVKKVLDSLIKDHYIIISSCRASLHFDAKYLREMIVFLKKEKIPFDEIDFGTYGKPVADWYIDDKGIPFKDNWEEIEKRLKQS